MTADNLAQAFITTFNQRDAQGLAILCHEDIAHDNAFGERLIGMDALRSRFAANFASLDWALHDTMIMTDASGNNAAIYGTLRGTYQHILDGLPSANGQQFDIPATMIIISDDGQITQISEFFATESLIKALS